MARGGGAEGRLAIDDRSSSDGLPEEFVGLIPSGFEGVADIRLVEDPVRRTLLDPAPALIDLV